MFMLKIKITGFPTGNFSPHISNSKAKRRKFPGGPVVKTPHICAGGMGATPGQGTKIPHAAWHGKKKKKWRQSKTGPEKALRAGI